MNDPHIINSGNVNYITGGFPPTQAQGGTVWYDTGQQCLVVYDGGQWQKLQNDGPTTMMAYDSAEALDWAIEKMRQEQNLSRLADKYPVVAEALGQLEVILKLCKNLDNDDNEQPK